MEKKRKKEKPVEGAMSEAQQRELIAKVIVNLPNGISAEVAQKWITDTTGALSELLAPLSEKPPTRFVVIDHFTTKNREVKIVSVNDDFRLLFLDKIEDVREIVLPRYNQDLVSDTVEEKIGGGFGGVERMVVTLTGVFKLMRLQPNGEKGKLLTNDCHNVFYVKTADDVLLAVAVRWCRLHGGWFIEARRLAWWYSGVRVFSAVPPLAA